MPITQEEWKEMKENERAGMIAKIQIELQELRKEIAILKARMG